MVSYTDLIDLLNDLVLLLNLANLPLKLLFHASTKQVSLLLTICLLQSLLVPFVLITLL